MAFQCSLSFVFLMCSLLADSFLSDLSITNYLDLKNMQRFVIEVLWLNENSDPPVSLCLSFSTSVFVIVSANVSVLSLSMFLSLFLFVFLFLSQSPPLSDYVSRSLSVVLHFLTIDYILACSHLSLGVCLRIKFMTKVQQSPVEITFHLP